MRKVINNKKWIPIKEAFERFGFGTRQVYWYVQQGQWSDGFVVKKSATGRWKFFCEEDWNKWQGLDNYQVA